MKMIYGTQYYRSPTPLREEWEGDLRKMGDFSLDVIQIRINWRNNERKENVYDFSDIDRLMELAEKYDKKVVIKFLLECAPQYIFEKYGGTRIGPKGELIRGGYHGAFYGGWMPCFTNKKIQERATLFVKKVVQRYKEHKNIILYNAWNEIRNRPMEECFCPECRKSFQNYLRKKFRTIDRLNDYYGASEESFGTISLPSTPHGVWDTYEFKLFKGRYQNYEKAKMVRDAIESEDKTRPIMCHVGVCAGFQESIADCVDDHYVSGAMSFFGTSIPFDHPMNTFDERMDIQVLNDYMRSVSENYFVHELYPSLGTWRLYDTPYDLRYKIMKILSRGAKGIMFWQYRSERIGHEMDCSGIMYMNGEPRPVAYTVKEAGDFVKKHDDLLYRSHAKESDIGIVFDFDSHLMSEIEDTFGPDFSFEFWGPLVNYKRSHQGLYKLIQGDDYDCSYIGTRDIRKIREKKAIFLPYYNLPKQDVLDELTDYVKNGGTLILDEGFALRDENTWINPYELKVPFMKAWMESRIKRDDTVTYDGISVPTTAYRTVYRVNGATVLATFANGEPAIQEVSYGKGKAILLGFSLGYKSYFERNGNYQKMLERLLPESVRKKEYSSLREGLEENRLTNDESDLVFLFNTEDTEKKISLREEVTENCLDGTIKGNVLTLPGKSIAMMVVNNSGNKH